MLIEFSSLEFVPFQVFQNYLYMVSLHQLPYIVYAMWYTNLTKDFIGCWCLVNVFGFADHFHFSCKFRPFFLCPPVHVIFLLENPLKWMRVFKTELKTLLSTKHIGKYSGASTLEKYKIHLYVCIVFGVLLVLHFEWHWCWRWLCYTSIAYGDEYYAFV